MNKKRILASIAAGVLTLSLSFTALAQGKIFVDLQEVKSDTQPQIINDRTMVPVRAITEMIGYDVNWIPEKQQVEVCEKGDKTPVIIMNIDKTKAYYSKYDEELGDIVGCEEVLESPATLINDRTFVPLRFISEAVGYTVDYNVDTEDVYMFSPDYTANQEGEGKEDTTAISDKEMEYVLSFTTDTWLKLSTEKKLEVANLINKWWADYENREPADIDEMVELLDHQMEQYNKNKVNEGVFETVCELYDIDVSIYIKG